jgi:hypothetical protein
MGRDVEGAKPGQLVTSSHVDAAVRLGTVLQLA